MLVDFESLWFKSYCEAVLSSDRDTARANVTIALQMLDQCLQFSELGQEEREAILAARRHLLLIDEFDLPKAS